MRRCSRAAAVVAVLVVAAPPFDERRYLQLPERGPIFTLG